MSWPSIDAYLAGVAEPDRSALERLRVDILQVIPEAIEVISYSMPAFRVRGKVVAGFAAFTRHLSYFPHSGSVLAELAGELDGFGGTKGALHFTPEHPIPPELVRRLIEVRMRQAGLD